MKIERNDLPQFKYWAYHENDIIYYRVKNLLFFKGATVGMFNDCIWTNLNYNVKNQELQYWNILNKYTKVKINYNKDIDMVVKPEIKNKLVLLTKDFGLINRYIGKAQGLLIGNGKSRLIVHNQNLERGIGSARSEIDRKIIKLINFLDTNDIMVLNYGNSKGFRDYFYMIEKTGENCLTIHYFPINNIFYKITFKVYKDTNLMLIRNNFTNKKLIETLYNVIGNFSRIMEPIIDEVKTIIEQDNRKGVGSKKCGKCYENTSYNLDVDYDNILVCDLNAKSYIAESADTYFKKRVIESGPKAAHIRKGHTRRLKDGRVIEVRPSIIHKEDYVGYTKAYQVKEG